MKIIRGLILVLAGALAVATPAHAAPITLIGGTAGSIPDNTASPVNDFLLPFFSSSNTQIGGYFGTQIRVDAPVASNILFEFFGADAFFHNEFNVVGTELFHNTGSPNPEIAPSLAAPFGSFQKTIVGSGLLPFSFDIDGDKSSVANGANPDLALGPIGPNFFATCDPFSSAAGSGGTTCGSLYLFLDDGGAGIDPDFDDFMVRVTVTPGDVPTPEIRLVDPVPVPEPATLSLLGLGLLGAAGRRVRARRKRESGSATP